VPKRKSSSSGGTNAESGWPWYGDQCAYDALHGRCKMPASLSSHAGNRRRQLCRYHFNVLVNGLEPDTEYSWAGDSEDWLLLHGRYPELHDPTKQRCVDCSERHDRATMLVLVEGVLEVWRCHDCWWERKKEQLERKSAEGKRATGLAAGVTRFLGPGRRGGSSDRQEASATGTDDSGPSV